MRLQFKLNIRTCLAASVLLHFGVLVLLTHSGQLKQHEKPKSLGSNVHIELLLKREDAQSSAGSDGTGLRVNNQGITKPCKGNREYLGIGITFMPGTHVVVTAPPGYPAYEAGIRIGDYLMDPWTRENEHGVVTMIAIRGYEKHVFHIKMDRICYSEDL